MRFVDCGAWYALFVPADANHQAADGWLSANPCRLITTDYIIDETLTLMRARGYPKRALDFGRTVFGGGLAEVHYLTRGEIAEAWRVFERFQDKEWSFTDCTSKVVMEMLGITEAFASDHHFRQFGTVTVVP